VSYFIDIPALIVTAGLSLLLLTAVLGVRPWRELLLLAAGLPADLVLLHLWSQWGAVLAMLSGVLGSLISLVLMQQNLDDPAALGPGAAVMLLTAMYGLGLTILVFVLVLLWVLRRQSADTDEHPSSDSLAAPAAVGLSGASLVIVLFTLLLLVLISASFVSM